MANPIRVIHIVRAFQTGGLETLVLEMCRRIASRGDVEVSTLALLPGDGLELRPQYGDVPCRVLTGPAGRGKLATWRALRSLFREARPDVVHAHNFLALARSGLAARWAGVPALVATKHGAYWPKLMGSRRLAGRCYRMADAIIAVSNDVREGLLARYRLPPERVRVVLNGIDTERFRPSERHRDGELERVLGVSGDPLLGTVCRLSPEKGVPTLLEAFGAVLQGAPEARLVIVGDGPLRAECEALAEGLGLGAAVRFLGTRDDVAAIYPLLDVYVQPSYAEGISLTMLEACSCALPVVATTVGGNPEIIEDAMTGRLVPPWDAHALAGAVLRTWRARDDALAMGRATRERMVERFSLDRMVSDHVALYREVLDARAAADGDSAPE